MATRDKGTVRPNIFKRTGTTKDQGDNDPVELEKPKTRSGLYLTQDADMALEELRLMLYRKTGKRPSRSDVAEQAIQKMYADLKSDVS